MYVSVCVFVFVCVYVCVYIYIGMYIYIGIYIYDTFIGISHLASLLSLSLYRYVYS